MKTIFNRTVDSFDIQSATALPFSLNVAGKPLSEALSNWRIAAESADEGCVQRTYEGALTPDGLTLTCEQKIFRNDQGLEWVLTLENRGHTDSPIIDRIHSANLHFDDCNAGTLPEFALNDLDQITPADSVYTIDHASYVLHRINGAPSNQMDFFPESIGLMAGATYILSGGGGRSSDKDFPFFQLDMATVTAKMALGWSGQWQADISVDDAHNLSIQAGLPEARFYLKPGEKIRLPRILLMLHTDPREDSHNAFRRLLKNHYIPRLTGHTQEAHLYCNTCFTRGGTWLNECNEQNQISLIRALSELDVESVITDAGWFKGGWPEGAGNWDPDPKKYPNGMKPVADAAREHGMRYGLWFEPERVMRDTTVHRDHPDWVLWRKDKEHITFVSEASSTGLLNFGLPEVQDYFYNIVAERILEGGLQCYRIDFNMPPLEWWRQNDETDRKGLTEIKYINGLYAHWDRLFTDFPDLFRVNCASGGRRIDLETISRFHVHQKSDLWFKNVTDQCSLFGLSHFLPNGVIMTPLALMDDTSFCSAAASSLCLGWIADGDVFDTARARKLINRYQQLRSLLNKNWYALTPCSRRLDAVIAIQFHDPDQDRGALMIHHRENSQVESMTFTLKGLLAEHTYRFTAADGDQSDEACVTQGSALRNGIPWQLPQAGTSQLYFYEPM